MEPSKKSTTDGRLTKQVSQRISEFERKAMEAHESAVSHRERTRRVTNEHTRAEVALNQSLGIMGGCVATELIEKWQNQLQGVPPVSRPSPEHGDVVIIGRQR